MNDPTQTARRSSAPVLIVAMLQGLLLYWIERAQEYGEWPGNSHAAHAAFFSLAFFIGPLIYSLVLSSNRRLGWLFVAVIAAFLLGSSWQFAAHEWVPEGPAIGPARLQVPLLFLQWLLLMHLVPFVQAYLEQGSWRFPYSLLFRYSWQNVLQLALATLFTGIFYGLVSLWGQLFRMLGLEFALVLVFKVPGYGWLLVALAFGIGYYLMGSAERLLLAIRQQVLSLLKWLTPVATLILVAFAVALLLRAPALLAEHRHFVRAVWLLWLVIVTVYLYNAAYQDGSSDEPYPPRLGRLLRFAAPLLVLLAGMAAYDLWVRIAAYGLTPSRFWATVVAAIVSAYALGYAVAGLRAGRWMAAMGRSNIGVALGLIAVLALALTPVLSAERLSARSQAARLLASAGTAGPTDFMALRFDFGSYGQDELRRLAGESSAPASIQKGAQLALAVKDLMQRWQFKYTTVPARDVVLEAFPAGSVIDADLRKKIQDAMPAPIKPVTPDYDAEPVDPTFMAVGTIEASNPELCSLKLPCPVLFADLDNDGQPEAIVFLQQQATVYERGRGGWTAIGTANCPSNRATKKPITNAELLSELRAGDYRVVEPHWKTLQIGGQPLFMNLPDPVQPAK